MPRVSLKERERELLFNLVCDSLVRLGDDLASLYDESESAAEAVDEDDERKIRDAIAQRDALVVKLAHAKVTK